MDPIQDNAAAQASAAALEPTAEPGDSASFPSSTDETEEVEIVCIRAIQSRDLGVIAEPGERRIVPQSRLEAFLLTEAFQMLGPVVRPPAPPAAPPKSSRRSKAD
jgi:hypothetical protein